jgi:hypothetical protein
MGGVGVADAVDPVESGILIVIIIIVQAFPGH